MLAVGTTLSILLTVAVVLPVLPAASWNVKINEPLPVNVYPVDAPLFVTVTPVLFNESVAITFPFVGAEVE